MRKQKFYFFSNFPPENIGRLTKEEAIEMQIDTTNAISKALAAANKLVTLQSYVLGGRAILLPSHITFNATNKRDSVTSDRIYKIEDAVYYCLYLDFLSTVQNAEQQCRDILEKEGLNKLEASRRIIFNCFKMQAIFKTYSSCKVKRFTLNSVKDLFTNLSKDYFLSIAAEDAAKAANILLLPKEVCAKILIESYKLIKFSNESVLVMQRGITQHEINLKLIIVALIAFTEAITLTEATHVVIIEPQDSIVYFNLDSKLELKVLGKQDVKTTS
ncbi:hypothetical protein HBI79_141910 [Parastagonospora nodorum]|nr:hypothetical protein HBI79_141910 [Parastagonospora nodorum]